VALAPETLQVFLGTLMSLAALFTNSHKMQLTPVLEMAQAQSKSQSKSSAKWHPEAEARADELFKALYTCAPPLCSPVLSSSPLRPRVEGRVRAR